MFHQSDNQEYKFEDKVTSISLMKQIERVKKLAHNYLKNLIKSSLKYLAPS